MYDETNSSFGNSAVSGLFAGIVGGLAMLAAMVIQALLLGGTAGKMLSRFSLGASGSPLGGALTHVAVSAVYGVIFGLLLHGLRSAWQGHIPGWLAGLVFAMVLLLLAFGVVLPNTAPGLAELPPSFLVIGHLAYGLGLGLAYRR